jgi:hypothetical protein
MVTAFTAVALLWAASSPSISIDQTRILIDILSRMQPRACPTSNASYYPSSFLRMRPAISDSAPLTRCPSDHHHLSLQGLRSPSVNLPLKPKPRHLPRRGSRQASLKRAQQLLQQGSSNHRPRFRKPLQNPLLPRARSSILWMTMSPSVGGKTP